MKRIFLSALIGVGMAALIFQISSGSEAARPPEDYPLVCRGGGTLNIASSEGKLGFTFAHGTGPATDGLLPGQCSWVDRRMYDSEPYRVSEPTEDVPLAPRPKWYGELRSSEKYWTFMVSNTGAGQLIATSARPGGVDVRPTTTTGFTPSADGVEVFETLQYFDECGSSFEGGMLAAPAGEAAPGTNHVGYVNHWHEGGFLLGCTTQSNSAFRGTVWFDLNEIFSKPSPKAEYALLTFKKILAVANDANGKPITRTCHDKLHAASEDWMKDHPYSSLGYFSKDHFVAAGAFDFSAPIDSCPPAGCSIDVTDVVNGWILHPELRYGFVMIGEDEVFLAKLHPKTNDACETRYGDFRLTVTYKYDKPRILVIPLRINYALASNGATASAQNFTADGAYPGLHFQPAYAIDGLRHTTSDGGNYWRDEHGLPSWLEVDFSGAKTINEIDVITIQIPGYETGADPSPTTS